MLHGIVTGFQCGLLEELDNLESQLQDALMYCNLSIISSNEMMFLKDIGHSEDAILSIKIYNQLLRSGAKVDFDITSPKDNMLILEKYAGTDHCFHSGTYFRTIG